MTAALHPESFPILPADRSLESLALAINEEHALARPRNLADLVALQKTLKIKNRHTDHAIPISQTTKASPK